MVYYVSPQIWAWRPGRLKTIRSVADRVLVIFPFEEAIYRRGGVPVEFVGHPLVDLAKPSAPRDVFLRGLGLAPQAPTVAILPGSRPNEVSRILPDLVAAAQRIRSAVAGAQFVIARAPHLDDRSVRGGEDARPVAGGRRSTGDTDAVLASADVALTASGTATVQTAIHDTPMVVVYRLSPLTYRLGRRLVKLDTFGMVNLIAGERIVPELIQDAFTPEAVADEAISMLTDPARAARIRKGSRASGAPGRTRRKPPRGRKRSSRCYEHDPTMFCWAVPSRARRLRRPPRSSSRRISASCRVKRSRSRAAGSWRSTRGGPTIAGESRPSSRSRPRAI